MSGPLFYVVDEGPTRFYLTLKEAVDDATHQIECCRDYCDPEWPSGVEDIAVFECKAETDEPTEDGRCLYRSVEINVREAEEGDGADYWCDYAMRPVARNTPHSTPPETTHER